MNSNEIKVLHDKPFKGRFKPLKQKDYRHTVVADLGMCYPTCTSKQKKRTVQLKCECGDIITVQEKPFRQDPDRVCKKCANKHKVIFGDSSKDSIGFYLHKIHSGVKGRCTNPKNKDYTKYSKFGMYAPWVDYKVFRKWALANGYKPGLTIDRIDNTKGYYPNNCRWTTKSIQAQNTKVLRSTNKSGYRGVSWNRAESVWKVNIMVKRKNVYLGRFDTALEAAKVYDAYVVNHNTHHNINGVLYSQLR